MKLKNISRQKKQTMVLYTCNKDKEQQTQIKKVRIETMTKREAISLAEKYIKSGVHTPTLENKEVKKMMKKIAANAVCLGLYNFNKLVIGHIGDGDFTTIKPVWENARVGMVKCLAIINNEGEDLKNVLSLEDIEDAVRFTIFELETSEDDDE